MALKLLRCFLAVIVGTLLFEYCVTANEVLSNNLSVKPTKLWRFLDDQDQSVVQRFRENIDEFSVGRIQCLRYCIKRRSIEDEAPRVLHLIWNLEAKNKLEMGSTLISDKDFTPEILQGKSIKSDDSWNQQNKCTFSVIIGCDISQKLEDNYSDAEKKFIKSLQPNLDILEGSGDKHSSALNEKLVDEGNLANETEISFRVQPDQAEVSAILLGNISKIDLKMPVEGATFGTTTTKKTPQLTLATSRMPDGVYGLRLNILNPPPGGWRLRLTGMRDENYRLIVTSTEMPEISSAKAAFEFLDEHLPTLQNDDFQSMHETSGIAPRQIKIIDKNVDQIKSPVQSEMNDEFSGRMISDRRSIDEQDEDRSFKFPTEKNDVEIMDPMTNITTRMGAEIQDRMVDRQSIELDDLSRSISDELPIKKYLLVDVNPNTNLIANPGTIHRVAFDITNNYLFAIRHYFSPTRSSFRILSIEPPFGFVEIGPGQTVTVGVVIQTPITASDSVNKLTLQVQGAENLEKSVNIYVRAQGNRVYDDVRPTIYYYFNNNCRGRTSAEKCLKSFWSVDITVQDSDSGLKSVTSAPRGVYPRSQYTSGTSSPAYFYYSSNCCNRVVEVTATDVSGNVYSRKIDVEEWYNFSEGEIAAIVIGTLFIILLIILIVITVLYCMNRRDSHDLPYSQRYGSRSPPRSE